MTHSNLHSFKVTRSCSKSITGRIWSWPWVTLLPLRLSGKFPFSSSLRCPPLDQFLSPPSVIRRLHSQTNRSVMNFGASSPLSIKLLSRFQLPGHISSQFPQPIDVRLLPGGTSLVAFAVLDARGGPVSTRVSLWDLQDTASPRCVVDLPVCMEGMNYPRTAVELDEERGVATLVLGYSPSEAPK